MLILIGLVAVVYAMEEMVAKDAMEPKHDLEGAEGKKRGYYGGYGGGYGGLKFFLNQDMNFNSVIL